jgi:hypothetical protein
MYGMVLVAAKPLGDDDELYVDYRLNPAAELPSWYSNYGRDSQTQCHAHVQPVITVYRKEVNRKMFAISRVLFAL